MVSVGFCVVSLGIRAHSLWDPPSSASQVLGWQVCLTSARHCSSHNLTLSLRWGLPVVWLSFPTSFMHPMPIWAFSFMKLEASLLASQLWIYSGQTPCRKLNILGVHKLSLPLFHFSQIAVLELKWIWCFFFHLLCWAQIGRRLAQLLVILFYVQS